MVEFDKQVQQGNVLKVLSLESKFLIGPRFLGANVN